MIGHCLSAGESIHRLKEIQAPAGLPVCVAVRFISRPVFR